MLNRTHWGDLRSDPGSFDRTAIERDVADRRTRLLNIEIGIVTGCEAAAGPATTKARASGTGAGWDRTAWDRYMRAAWRFTNTEGNQMSRLRDDIRHLEGILEHGAPLGTGADRSCNQAGECS